MGLHEASYEKMDVCSWVRNMAAKKHSKVIHVNCLRKYVERGEIARLDVVIEEPRNGLRGVCEGYDEEELGQLIGKYDAVFSDAPGHTKKVAMTIDTGDPHQ